MMTETPLSPTLKPGILNENPPLCTYTVQVPKFEYNTIQINNLCKDEVVDWLFINGYFKDAAAIDMCGKTFVHLEDKNGHEKYVRMHCNHDYCPRCGKNGSQAHKKRVVRAVDRLIWTKTLGYMVFTLPKEISLNMPQTDKLSILLKKAWQIVKESFDTPGGMVRVHLLGNEPENLHIHINVLFPVLNKDNKGMVSRETLNDIRKKWTEVVNKEFNLTCGMTNVYYKFATQTGRMLHKISYVLRPIVTPDKFLTLSEPDRRKILALRGWHNTRWYGKLANSQYKKYLNSIGILRETEKKDITTSNICPVCGEKYRLIDVVSPESMPRHELRALDNNVFIDLATFSYLKSRGQPE